MISEQQLISALGLAQKAGKLASGDYAVKSAIKGGKVKLLFLAADAAENTSKEYKYLAETYGFQLVEVLNRQRLGLAIGKAQRTAVAVIDNSFVKMFLK